MAARDGILSGTRWQNKVTPLKLKKHAPPHSNPVSLHRPQAAPGSATPATEEKLKFGKLKAEIRKTENWKPASEGKSGLEKNQPRNHKSVGKAATVAGHVGPGFHNWPIGHILQDNDRETADSQPVPRQKTLGETFGAATGVGAPSDRRNVES